jgi:arsenite methyltransferase
MRGDCTFVDAAFGVVASNFVIHEVNTPQELEQMMSEMIRVLRPGGRLALIDLIVTGQCVEILRPARYARRLPGSCGGLSFWLGTILKFGTFQIHLITGSTERPN